MKTKTYFLLFLCCFVVACERNINKIPENSPQKEEEETNPNDEVFPEPINHDFISMAYLASNLIGLHKQQPENVTSFLNKYHWEGISDVIIIKGIFMMGKDGTLITGWNKDDWPDISKEAIDYNGENLDEQKEREKLCSKEIVEETVKYFKRKGIRIWFSQQGYGWLSRKTSQEITLKNLGLTQNYAQTLTALCKEFGCYGVDFDDEFPSKEAVAGYRFLIKYVKEAGLQVSLCLQSDYQSKPHEVLNFHEMIANGIVNHIHCMQYTAGLIADPSTEARLKVRANTLEAWEKAFPSSFQGNQNQVKFLSGIGYYTNGSSPLNMMKLYNKFGEKAFTDGIFHNLSPSKGEEKVYYVFTLDNIKGIVRQAKERGWSGVFIWLTSHDFTTDFPDKYSRQISLREEIETIWKQETER